MKDIIKYYLQLIVLMFCLFTSACSDDDETVTPVFPDLQKIECAVGDTKTLTFEATDNWILISSSLWCYFEQDGEQTFTCSGGVGEQTVTIHISDDATELMKSYKAELTMTMAGSRQVIAEVTRPSTGYELHAFDAEQTIEYTAENPYVQDYGGKAYFWVSSNADWIVESSESLDLSKTNISGEAGNNVKITPLLKQGTENRKTAWTQELIFKNRKGEVISKLPVHYDGIPADKIEFSNDNIYSNKIKASVDGESYTFKNQSYEAEGVPLTVIARNDEYTYVCVEYTSTMGPETGWNEEWSFKLLTGFKNWLWIEDDSNYIGALIEQDAFVATSGLSIMDSYTFRPLYDGAGNAIQAEPYAGEMTENELIEKYGTSNVYTVYSFTLGMSYTQIFVLPNGYTGSNLQATTILNGKNTAWSGISLEPGQNSSGQMGINIYGMNSEANGDEMCITIKNGTEPYAVLLIETRYSD